MEKHKAGVGRIHLCSCHVASLASLGYFGSDLVVKEWPKSFRRLAVALVPTKYEIVFTAW